MKYRKYEDQRQNISMAVCLGKKENGKITWVLGLFLMLFIMLLAVTQLQILKIRAASDLVSDALAAGGLASEIIDLERYGTDHAIVISDAEGAYSVYKKILPDNLGTDIADESTDGCNPGTVICGPIIIEKFCIYNVTDDEVETVTVDDTGVKSRNTGKLGEVHAPNGQTVYSTGIYSEISFRVEGIFGTFIEARKGKLVEIK